MLPLLPRTKTLVIKLGTRVVTEGADALATQRLQKLVEEVSALHTQGVQCLIVSSGAVGLGRKKLKFGTKKLSLAEKQAAAAVGQAYLMNYYCEAFAKHHIQTAQVLVTARDFSDRSALLNLSRLFNELSGLKIIPVINENDCTSVAEISEESEKSFGDNDRLAALLSSQFGADVLLLLSDVEGVFDDNPLQNKNAQKISTLNDESLKKLKFSDQSSALSRGGMASKVEAARLAAVSGVITVVASGFTQNIIQKVLSASDATTFPGTLIETQAATDQQKRHQVSPRKRWLSWMSGFEGSVVVDEGAKLALQSGKSLLFAGIQQINGSFIADSVIRILDSAGNEIGRGLSQVSDDLAKLCVGKKSDVIKKSYPHVDEFIHRDWMVIYEHSS